MYQLHNWESQELQNVDLAWSLSQRLKFSSVKQNNYELESSARFRDIEKWVTFNSLIIEKMMKNNKIFAVHLLVDPWSDFLCRNWFILKCLIKHHVLTNISNYHKCSEDVLTCAEHFSPQNDTIIWIKIQHIQRLQGYDLFLLSGTHVYVVAIMYVQATSQEKRSWSTSKIQNVHQKDNFVDNRDDDTDKNDDIDVIFNELRFILVHFHVCFLRFSSFTTIYHTLYFEDENCVSKF